MPQSNAVPGPRRGAAPTVVLDRTTRVHTGASGALLVGGRPLRVLRLDRSGAAVLLRWRTGGTVRSAPELQLARRLHDDGLALLRAPTTLTTDDVTVVVPVRDRSAQLDACLAGIGACAELLVVDDASDDAAAVAAVIVRHGAMLVVRKVNGGPAAARNTGLAAVRTPLVAFVDSDVTLPPGWLSGLLPALLDEAVAAVAPRVIGAGGPGPLARYETRHGPLDLGPLAGPVRSGARVGYLPAAVLLCRVDALRLPDASRDLSPAPVADPTERAGRTGFDVTMRVAEDVDLVWRLAAQGRTVRYEPGVVVTHATRPGLGGWLAQRHGYGRGAAQLDLRHPGQVAPAVLGRWSAPTLALLAARRPALAASVAAATATVLHRRLPAAPGRGVEAVRLTAAGVGWTGLSLAEAAARVWLPVLLPTALLWPGARHLAAAVVLTRLARTHTRPSEGVLRVLDDLAYSSGVWRGALTHRRPAVVLPGWR